MVYACFDALLAHFDGDCADGAARYPDAHWRVALILACLRLALP